MWRSVLAVILVPSLMWSQNPPTLSTEHPQDSSSPTEINGATYEALTQMQQIRQGTTERGLSAQSRSRFDPPETGVRSRGRHYAERLPVSARRPESALVSERSSAPRLSEDGHSIQGESLAEGCFRRPCVAGKAYLPGRARSAGASTPRAVSRTASHRDRARLSHHEEHCVYTKIWRPSRRPSCADVGALPDPDSSNRRRCTRLSRRANRLL